MCVLAPSTIVTVTIEDGGDRGAELHFHAGGQGFWVARLLGRLGVPTTMCTVFGGESGRVAAALVAAEPIDVRAVQRNDDNGAWVHDRRSGDRRTVAEVSDSALRRHETDELFGAALAAGLSTGLCVLTGPQQPPMLDGSHYHRLTEGLRDNGVEVIADLSGKHLRATLAAGVDFCKVSHEDLLASEPDAARGREPVELLGWLTGAVHAVITCADEPAIAMLDGRPMEVAGPALRPVDHRGAGDAFTALVAAARYWGLDWDDAVRWGAAAGALTVVRRGLATADRREIHHLVDRIRLRPIDVTR